MMASMINFSAFFIGLASKFVKFVDGFPKSVTGRILRREPTPDLLFLVAGEKAAKGIV
jgi:hypothetical protein